MLRNVKSKQECAQKSLRTPKADPEFSVGEGASPLAAPTYDFATFSEKLHEIEKILSRKWAPH